jgi:hypothetical protein
MSDAEHDDGKVWGFMENGVFVVLPKAPMLLAGLGPPPFSIALHPSGRLRHVIHAPEEDAPCP